MKLNTLAKTLLVAGALASTYACKKDKDKEELPSLNGYVKIDVPLYLLQGDSIEITPEGVTHPDGGKLGYVVTLSKKGKEVARDTVKAFDDPEIGSFNYTFSADSLGSYSLTASAFAEGYTSSSASKSINVVGGLTRYVKEVVDGQEVYHISKNPVASITGHGIDLDNGKYFDIRSNRYFYKELTGGLYWMQNNLMDNGGMPYENFEALNPIFGNYYTYEEAMKACPEGWRLPTAAEWDALIAQTKTRLAENPEAGQTVPGAWIPDAEFNGTKMLEYWPANDNGLGDLTNAMELCVLPAGYANLPAKQFDGVFLYAMFWSSDLDPDNDSQAKVYSLYNYWDTVHVTMADKSSFGANVRCVKNK